MVVGFDHPLDTDTDTDTVMRLVLGVIPEGWRVRTAEIACVDCELIHIGFGQWLRHCLHIQRHTAFAQEVAQHDDYDNLDVIIRADSPRL